MQTPRRINSAAAFYALHNGPVIAGASYRAFDPAALSAAAEAFRPAVASAEPAASYWAAEAHKSVRAAFRRSAQNHAQERA